MWRASDSIAADEETDLETEVVAPEDEAQMLLVEQTLHRCAACRRPLGMSGALEPTRRVREYALQAIQDAEQAVAGAVRVDWTADELLCLAFVFQCLQLREPFLYALDRMLEALEPRDMLLVLFTYQSTLQQFGQYEAYLRAVVRETVRTVIRSLPDIAAAAASLSEPDIRDALAYTNDQIASLAATVTQRATETQLIAAVEQRLLLVTRTLERLLRARLQTARRAPDAEPRRAPVRRRVPLERACANADTGRIDRRCRKHRNNPRWIGYDCEASVCEQWD